MERALENLQKRKATEPNSEGRANKVGSDGTPFDPLRELPELLL
jgi:hypothetical protein